MRWGRVFCISEMLGRRARQGAAACRVGSLCGSHASRRRAASLAALEPFAAN